MESQKFCLKWDGFHSNVTSVFDHLRQHDELVDVTLCCEGQRVRAHRMMLSACSPYFRDLLKNNQCQQMVIFLRDTSSADLHAIIEFMYRGSVNISQTQLASFIKTAEMLQIKGLSGDDDKSTAPPSAPRRSQPPSPRPLRPSSPPVKRRRTSGQERPEPPRSPVAAPAEPPLQPPPPVPSAVGPPATAPPAADSPRSCSNQLASGGVSLLAPPAATPHELKVEKVDLTEEEGDVSLDATLGYVAELEGAGYAEPPDPAVAADAAAALGSLAGPSQRLAEDGSSQGHVCVECGARYAHRASLSEHVKRHRGLTRCALCAEEFAVTFTLRRHLVRKHGLNAEDAGRLTNQRWTIQCRPNMAATASAHRNSHAEEASQVLPVVAGGAVGCGAPQLPITDRSVPPPGGAASPAVMPPPARPASLATAGRGPPTVHQRHS